MASIVNTKDMLTSEGKIYLAIIGSTNSEYDKFIAQLKEYEGYGIVRLENMEQVDNNSFDIKISSILTSSATKITTLPSNGAPILTYKSENSEMSNANWISIDSEKGIESAVGQLVQAGLQVRRDELYSKYASNLAEILSSDSLDIERILDLMQQKDQVALGHIKSVAELGSVLIEGMEITGLAEELTEEQKANFGTVALLHDLGKLLTPDQLLKNTDRLNGNEFAEMQRHVEVDLELAQNEKTRELLETAIKHHYRYDGNGYGGQKQDKLTGDEIPIQQRMMPVIDSFDAIIDPGRTYQGVSETSKVEIAINIIYNNSQEKTETNKSGGQFDPKVGYAFLVGFKKRFEEDSKFRDKWLQAEGMVTTPESKQERISAIISCLEQNIDKFEESLNKKEDKAF